METGPLTALEQLEKSILTYAINQSYTFKDAAQSLGVDESTLWQKRKDYGIAKPPPGTTPRRPALTPEELLQGFRLELAR